MNEELKFDHFENIEELLKHIDIWYEEDDVFYTRYFGLNDLHNLGLYINQLQNNWNELKSWLEEEYEHCDKIGNPAIGYAMGQIRRTKEKMQELEENNNER